MLKLKLKGFTLAEVLITLGIIGVVAAMTLPTVVKPLLKRHILNSDKQYRVYSCKNTEAADLISGPQPI